MRLLIVALTGSAHTYRYVDLLRETGWEVHLFEATASSRPHPELTGVTVHVSEDCLAEPSAGVELRGPRSEEEHGWSGRVAHLSRVLDEVRPDVVHSHEITHAGALVDEVRRRRGGLGAPWVATNWGSDVFWYGRHPVYAERLGSVLAHCGYYGAECHRDVALARAFGFRGTVVGVWPVAGGVDLDAIAALRAPGPTSARRALTVKGVASEYGMAEVAFAAVARCADLLDGWELCVYQLDPELEPCARTVADEAGARYTRLSLLDVRQSSHDDLLAMHGRARVSLALSRSDGISTSFLEAVAMGAFPLQSGSSCGGELTPPGRGALFVPADDVDAVATALRRALTDDALVDGGAEINARVTAGLLDRRRVRAHVLDLYERVAADVAVGIA